MFPQEGEHGTVVQVDRLDRPPGLLFGPGARYNQEPPANPPALRTTEDILLYEPSYLSISDIAKPPIASLRGPASIFEDPTFVVAPENGMFGEDRMPLRSVAAEGEQPSRGVDFANGRE